MGRPRPAVKGLHWHRLDSVPSPGPGQRKYLCAGVPKGGYSVRPLGAKTEIPGKSKKRHEHEDQHFIPIEFTHSDRNALFHSHSSTMSRWSAAHGGGGELGAIPIRAHARRLQSL